jgi:hypothetical protein
MTGTAARGLPRPVRGLCREQCREIVCARTPFPPRRVLDFASAGMTAGGNPNHVFEQSIDVRTFPHCALVMRPMPLDDNCEKLVEAIDHCIGRAVALNLTHAVLLLRMAAMEVSDRSVDYPRGARRWKRSPRPVDGT